MKQFLLVGFLILTVSACATSEYVKDISDVPEPVAVVEEVKAVEVARVVSVSQIAAINETVLFDFDSYELDLVAQVFLKKIAGQMETYPDTLLVLKGHTDKYGSDEYNQILSEDRVDAVENFLAEEGVTAERIVSAEGFGKTQLLPDVTHRENRRVIIMSVDNK